MPELPEVETVARTLRPRIVGRAVRAVRTSGLALREPVDEGALRRACEGARFAAIERRGKFLLLRLSSGGTLLAHLGMSGQLRVVTAGADRAPHTHAVFTLDDGHELRYVDPRRFGVLSAFASEAALARSAALAGLGADPLTDAFTVEALAAAAAATRRAVKDFLLDQRHVAGLGNIYAAEALFRAGVSPRRRADRLGRARVVRLHDAIRAVLLDAVSRRGTTLRDYRDAEGGAGENQLHLAVYGREGAACGCGAHIRRLVQGARSTFFCPRCQR